MSKQKLIVMDLDGTFANSMKWQKQYFTNGIEDEEGYHKHLLEFPVNEMLLEMVNMYIKSGYNVLFLSARPDKYYEQTVKWFTNIHCKNRRFDVELHIKCYLILKTIEHLTSAEWKLQTLNRLCKNYDIGLCIDDSPDVCHTLRQAGYNVLQMESLYDNS